MYKVDLSKALLDAYKSKNENANNKTTEQTSLPNVLKFHAEFSEIKIFLKKKMLPTLPYPSGHSFRACFAYKADFIHGLFCPSN